MNILDGCCFDFSKQTNKLVTTLNTEINNLIALSIVAVTELGGRVHIGRLTDWYVAVIRIHIHKVKFLTTVSLIVGTKVNIDFLHIIQGSKISASFIPIIVISS